ncbi:hypothetical protein HDV00_007879 [Rhizophlyctis rosea]|nr:hypothetical protein HDV00_007879 [Rhizophlyctis rosea]
MSNAGPSGKPPVGKLQTGDGRWNAWRKSIQGHLPNPTSFVLPLHPLQTSTSTSNLNTPPLSPALSDHSDTRSIKSVDQREAENAAQDPVYDPSVGLIAEYEHPDPEVEAAASLLRILEDTIRSFRLDGSYDPLVRSLYGLADVVRHGPQPDPKRKMRLGGLSEESKEEWALPANPYLAFPRAAKSSRTFLMSAVDLAGRFAASGPDGTSTSLDEPEGENQSEEKMVKAEEETPAGENAGGETKPAEDSVPPESDRLDAPYIIVSTDAAAPQSLAPEPTTIPSPAPTPSSEPVTADSPLFLELVSIMQDIAALLHLCFTSTRAEVQWQAGDAARKMDGLAMRVLRAEDALPRLPPSKLEDEGVFSGCSFKEILALSGTNGDPSAPEYIEARGGQTYFTGNPLQIVRVIRLLEVDRSSAERIVKIRFPEAFELHKHLVVEREKRLAAAQLVPHHPEMAAVWRTNNFGTSVVASQLFDALRRHLESVGASGALVQDKALETRYAASFPVSNNVVFVADLNSVFRPTPKAPLGSWILFNAHRQAAMDLAWLKCCRELESEIASLSIIPDSNQRQRHLLRERVRLVMEQAALIPSAPSLDPGPLTEADAAGAVSVAVALMWDEPSGDVTNWRKLHGTLVRARDLLKGSARPLDAVIRSMWTPITFPKEETVVLADEFAGLGGQLAVAMGGMATVVGEESKLIDSGVASVRSVTPTEAGSGDVVEEGRVTDGVTVAEPVSEVEGGGDGAVVVEESVQSLEEVEGPTAVEEGMAESTVEPPAESPKEPGRTGLRRSTALRRRTVTNVAFDPASDVAAAQSDANRITDAEKEAANAMFAEGVEKEKEGDVEEAFASFRIAARRGHPEACRKIAAMYVRGTWLVRNEEKGREWLERARVGEGEVEEVLEQLSREVT